jgi:hypothetical protein
MGEVERIRSHGPSAHRPDCDCTRCRGFQPGNALHLSHGVYSARQIEPRAEEIVAQIEAMASWLLPTDRPMVSLLAITLARVERGSAALAEVDAAASSDLSAYISESGGLVFDRLRRDVRSWISTSLKLATELGLTPAARARLGLDAARTKRALSLVELHEAAAAEEAEFIEETDEP